MTNNMKKKSTEEEGNKKGHKRKVSSSGKMNSLSKGSNSHLYGNNHLRESRTLEDDLGNNSKKGSNKSNRMSIDLT